MLTLFHPKPKGAFSWKIQPCNGVASNQLCVAVLLKVHHVCFFRSLASCD